MYCAMKPPSVMVWSEMNTTVISPLLPVKVWVMSVSSPESSPSEITGAFSSSPS